MNAISKVALSAVAAFAFLGGITQNADALTITGTTGAKYLLSGSAISAPSTAVFNISFENNTAGTNLSLCVGTETDFAAGTCATELASSGGPGFTFLAITSGTNLNGKWIYVIRNVGSAASNFTVTIE